MIGKLLELWREHLLSFEIPFWERTRSSERSRSVRSLGFAVTSKLRDDRGVPRHPYYWAPSLFRFHHVSPDELPRITCRARRVSGNSPGTSWWCQPDANQRPRPGWCMRWLAGALRARREVST